MSSLNRSQSNKLFQESKTYFPGGVNSPVRAFKSVGGTPLFITRGKGSHIWDADGNEFIDFCCSWGPLILGHAHPKVVESITSSAAKGTSFGAPSIEENTLAILAPAVLEFVERVCSWQKLLESLPVKE